jgi:hypothetical protein
MVDESKVDIDALMTFVTNMGEVFGDYGNGMDAVLSKINSATVGLCGSNEASMFRDWYNRAILESTGQFSADSSNGLTALMYGTVVMAANYRTGDLSQAQAMNDVTRAFNPAEGTPSLASVQAKQAAQKRATEPHVPAESGGTGRNGLPDPQDVEPPTPTSEEPSPFEQVRTHTDKYGKNERWHPPDPDAPPEKGPVPGEIPNY